MDRRLRVLVAEESHVMREAIARLLADSGDAELIGFAKTRLHVLGGILCHNPDVVILDLDLGDSAGLEVLKSIDAIRGDLARPLVIVFSNHVEETLRRRCRRHGAQFVLNKSDDFEQICDILHSLRISGTD